MIYDHDVKINGRWFTAGTEVSAVSSVKAETKAVDVKVEVAQPTENTNTKRSYKRK